MPNEKIFGIDLRCSFVVNAGRAAGKNEAVRLGLRYFGCGDVETNNLRINLAFTHAPRDDLGVLRAEIEDEDFGMSRFVVLLHGFGSGGVCGNGRGSGAPGLSDRRLGSSDRSRALPSEPSPRIPRARRSPLHAMWVVPVHLAHPRAPARPLSEEQQTRVSSGKISVRRSIGN